MVKIGHLGRYELFALVVVASIADIFVSFPHQLIESGGSAGWMIPLVSMVTCLLAWLVISQTVGRWGLGILSLLAVLFFLSDLASTMRLFNETVISTVLPKSPIWFIATPIVLVIVYFAYMGIEGVTRVSWFLFPYLLIGLIFMLLMNSNWMNIQYLSPVLGNGLTEVFLRGIHYTGIFMNLILLVILGPKLRDPKDVVRIGYVSILVIGIIYSVVTMVLILIAPPEATMRTPFPMYQLGRNIFLGRFVQRLESSFVFIWVAMAIIKMSISLWISTYLIAFASKMPVNRPLVFPIALTAFSLSFIPKSLPEMSEYKNLLFAWSWTILVAIPFALSVINRFRGRKGGNGNAHSAQNS